MKTGLQFSLHLTFTKRGTSKTTDVTERNGQLCCFHLNVYTDILIYHNKQECLVMLHNVYFFSGSTPPWKFSWRHYWLTLLLMNQLQQNILNFKLNILLEHDPNKQFSLTPYLPLPVPDNCRRPPGEWERHLQPVVDESGPRELPDHDLEGVRGALAAAISADQGEAPSADAVLINGSVRTHREN